MAEMINKKKRIQITRDELENFEIPQLPSLEELAWAFPVAGPTNLTTQKNNGQYFNIQDINAWKVLLLLQNYKHTLQGSLGGDVGTNGYPVSHTHFRDPFNLLDVTHLSPMFPDFVNGIYDKRAYIKQVEKSGKQSKGYFWTNIPEDLLTGVERIHKISWNTQYDEKDTRNYLKNVRETLRLGANFMNDVLTHSDEADRWAQLRKASIDDLTSGSYFQVATFNDGRAGLLQGISMGASNNKLRLKYFDRDQPIEYPLEKLRKADIKLWTIK